MEKKLKWEKIVQKEDKMHHISLSLSEGRRRAGKVKSSHEKMKSNQPIDKKPQKTRKITRIVLPMAQKELKNEEMIMPSSKHTSFTV